MACAKVITEKDACAMDGDTWEQKLHFIYLFPRQMKYATKSCVFTLNCVLGSQGNVLWGCFTEKESRHLTVLPFAYYIEIFNDFLKNDSRFI